MVAWLFYLGKGGEVKKLKVFLFGVVLVFGVVGISNAILWDRGGGLIYDDFLDITWLQDANYAQTSGYDSDGRMTWSQAVTWASGLSYHDPIRDVIWDDWRLPTIPELMSLMEREEQANLLYINPIFDAKQFRFWSADRLPAGEGGPSGAAWRVVFARGVVGWAVVKDLHYVRCVRSRQD